MKIKNKQNIERIDMYPTAWCYCPLGKDWYKISFEINFLVNDYYPDYCDVRKFVETEIDMQVLTIEDAVERMHKYLDEEYQPTSCIVKADVRVVNSHFPVVVYKSY